MPLVSPGYNKSQFRIKKYFKITHYTESVKDTFNGKDHALKNYKPNNQNKIRKYLKEQVHKCVYSMQNKHYMFLSNTT